MTMKKYAVLAVAVAVIGLPMATAQQASSSDGSKVGPGLVSPNSPFYGLEIAIDNAAVGLGMAKPGGVAQERAAEAQKMVRNENYKAAEKATKNLNRVAKKADSDDTEGLQKAEAVLEGVIERAPAEAREGLRNAQENIRQARERAGGQPESPGQGQVPENPGNRTGEQPEIPANETAGNETSDDGGQQNETAGPPVP